MAVRQRLRLKSSDVSAVATDRVGEFAIGKVHGSGQAPLIDRRSPQRFAFVHRWTARQQAERAHGKTIGRWRKGYSGIQRKGGGAGQFGGTGEARDSARQGPDQVVTLRGKRPGNVCMG